MAAKVEWTALVAWVGREVGKAARAVEVAVRREWGEHPWRRMAPQPGWLQPPPTANGGERAAAKHRAAPMPEAVVLANAVRQVASPTATACEEGPYACGSASCRAGDGASAAARARRKRVAKGGALPSPPSLPLGPLGPLGRPGSGESFFLCCIFREQNDDCMHVDTIGLNS